MILAGALGVANLFMSYLGTLFMLPGAAYLFLKWRTSREGLPSDPLLGAKVIVLYFRTLALHMILAAVTLIAYGGLKGGYQEEMQVGIGLMLGGGAFYLVAQTQARKLAGLALVERLYTAVNLLVTGMATIAAFTVTAIVLLQGRFAEVKLPACGLLVYGIAAFSQLQLFLGGRAPAGKE